jgi:hypothetical protein
VFVVLGLGQSRNISWFLRPAASKREAHANPKNEGRADPDGNAETAHHAMRI